MTNVAIIYQPHFKTNCFRVDRNNQTGSENNFVVVTCSPSYNGVWKYPSENTAKYKLWKNGNVVCYCVPIDDCIRVQSLESVKSPFIKNKIKEQQDNWYKSNVKNREYTYANKPKWIL